MINYAMFVGGYRLNDFTLALRVMCEGNATVGVNCGCNVQLRNGDIHRVYFQDTEDNCPMGFHTEDWGMFWRPDGSSCSSEEYDIVALGVDVKV